MKSKKWLAMLLAMTMAGSMALSACGGDGNDGSSSIGGGDSSTESSVEEQFSSPVITVTPETVEMNAGDEISLTFGVVVTDEYDSDLTATILDDDGFDAEVEGTYTITYTATNSKGKTATATRTIIVTAPLANINVEVPYDKSGVCGTALAFANANYHALTEDTQYNAAYSGIYHNVGTETIVVDVVGGSGEVAILNAYGEVIEARDGANGRFVNVDNPVRTSGPNSFTYGGEPYTVSSNCARYMQIPAGGMAIVVFQGFAGTGFNNDGRKFVCDNLVGYGFIVQVGLADGKTAPYTTYRNQAPTVKSPAPVNITKGAKTQDDVDAMVKAGLEIKDDGATFAPTDDITTGWDITIVDRGGLDVNTAGEYTYTLTVTDGTLTTEFTRLVKVVADVMTISVEGATAKDFEKSRVCVNQAAGNYANYDLCIYTKSFTGTLTANGFGAAMIIDAEGKIKAVYNGVNAEYLDATNIGTGNREGYGVTGIITSNDYLTKAWEALQDGETLLVGANDGGANLGRAWVLGFRRKTSNPVTTWIGTPVTISGITIA